MKTMTALCIAAALMSASAAVAAPKEDDALADRFQRLVSEHFPTADIARENGKFTAKHGTMMFTVHGHRVKYRGFTEETYQVEAPNYQGFILTLQIRPGPFETQAATIRPGYWRATMREPYWQVFAARLPTADGRSHYVIDFSYGSRLDAEFKRRILAAVPDVPSDAAPLRVEDTAVAPPNEMSLADHLAAVVKAHFPHAEITHGDGRFAAQHATMQYTVHGISKTGEIAERPHREEGPEFEGFILTLTAEDGQYAGAAVAPQTLERTYWKTYITRPPTADGQGHYAINFSYGAGLDEDFKQRIFAAFPKSAGQRDAASEGGRR